MIEYVLGENDAERVWEILDEELSVFKTSELTKESFANWIFLKDQLVDSLTTRPPRSWWLYSKDFTNATFHVVEKSIYIQLHEGCDDAKAAIARANDRLANAGFTWIEVDDEAADSAMHSKSDGLEYQAVFECPDGEVSKPNREQLDLAATTARSETLPDLHRLAAPASKLSYRTRSQKPVRGLDGLERERTPAFETMGAMASLRSLKPVRLMKEQGRKIGREMGAFRQEKRAVADPAVQDQSHQLAPT